MSRPLGEVLLLLVQGQGVLLQVPPLGQGCDQQQVGEQVLVLLHWLVLPCAVLASLPPASPLRLLTAPGPLLVLQLQ